MRKRLALMISLIFIVASLHTLFHIMVYGTGISGALESGISGLSIGGASLDEIKPQYKEISQTSVYILIGEWSILLLLGISAFIKNRKSIEENMKARPLIKKYKTKTKTDLDVLYEILKEKKHLKISTIAKIFGITSEVATSWSKTLESANLANLHYPRIGEPELTIIE